MVDVLFGLPQERMPIMAQFGSFGSDWIIHRELKKILMLWFM